MVCAFFISLQDIVKYRENGIRLVGNYKEVVMAQKSRCVSVSSSGSRVMVMVGELMIVIVNEVK